MIYKTFVWTNEPEKIKIKLVTDSKTYILPQLGPVRKKTGFSYRIIEGSGEFFGPQCYQNFQELSRIFEDSSAGRLIIPNFEPMSAFFDELCLSSDSGPEIVSYKFKFTQEPVYSESEKSDKFITPNFYLINPNENLWTVANKFEVPIETLLKLNPTISNPYDVLPNSKVKLS